MNSIAIEVAIGVALMYLLLSLMCTVINEVIASAFKLRSNMLSQAVSDLINDPALYENFYRHGMIQSVVIATKGTPAYFASKTVAGALLDSLAPGTPIVGVPQLQATVTAMPPSHIRDVIQAAINTGNNDLEKVRNNVAAWFDDAMDRVGGLYKRQAQLISFLVGLVIAIVLNADTLVVATAMWTDTPLRQQIISAAEQANKNLAPGSFQPANLQQAVAQEGSLHEQLRPFPVGWTATSLIWNGDAAHNAWLAIQKLVGLLITGLALSLGAPFWFDLLGKLINIRSTGAKPKTETAN